MSSVAACHARRAFAGVAISACLGAAHAVAQTPPAPATSVNAPNAAAPAAPAATAATAATSMPPAVSAVPAATAPPAISAPPAASTSAEADIRDIRGPKPVYSVWTIALLLAAGVLVAIGAYAAWRWNRRRKLRAVKLPFEIALQRI